MRVRRTEAFTEQAARFALRFCCEDCGYFFAADDRCAHGWPTTEHRQVYYRADDCDEVVFCKEFELK